MKITIYPCLAALLAIPCSAENYSGCCPERGISKRVFRDAASHETVSKRKMTDPDPISLLTASVPLKPVEGVLAPKRVSIVDRSDIIHRGELVTLVPKRAVIHLPEHLRGQVGKVQGKKLVNWPEFYRANRAWIDTVEVTRAQAEGLQPLSEALVKSFEKRTKAVIAVMQGGPISILPLKEPDSEVAEAGNTQQP